MSPCYAKKKTKKKLKIGGKVTHLFFSVVNKTKQTLFLKNIPKKLFINYEANRNTIYFLFFLLKISSKILTKVSKSGTVTIAYNRLVLRDPFLEWPETSINAHRVDLCLRLMPPDVPEVTE